MHSERRPQDGTPLTRDPAAGRLLRSGLILLAVMVGAAIVGVFELRQDRIIGATNRAKDLAVLLAEQTARTVQAVDLVVRETVAMVGAAGVTNPAQFKTAMATEHVHNVLVDRLRSLPQASSLALLDDTGRIVNYSRVWPVPVIEAADRDFFRYLRDHDDPGVFVGEPVINRSTAKWTIMLARRINGPAGQFLGVAVGVFDATYFEEFYRSISTTEGESVTLFRRDGMVMARYPHLEKMIGVRIAPHTPWYKAVAAGGGAYRTPGYIGGVPRIVSAEPLREYPLVVSAGIEEGVVLAPWRRQVIFIGVGTACALLGFIVLLRALQTQFRRLEGRTVELEESQNRFHDFALTSSDWFWETDESHILKYVSEGIRAFGQDPESRIGRSRLEVASSLERDQEKWKEHLATLDRHEAFRDFIYTAQLGTQPQHTVSISGKPFFGANGRFLGYRGTGRDITAQVQAERSLREAKEDAEAANRSKSEFLANMSHELRTPLNAILGFSEMIDCGLAGPVQPRQREYARLIHDSGQHLLNIINDILDLARVDAGKFDLHEEVAVDLRQLIDSCMTLVKSRALLRDLRLSVRSDVEMPPVTVDPTRLKQILLNLLSNAVKFTEPGGSVTVIVRRADGGGIAIDVSDTGSGMTPEELAIALEPFGQVDSAYNRSHEGTGLGLPLARRLASLHGGRLDIESQKGVGTTATVTLPASRILQTETPEPARNSEAAAQALSA